MRVRPHTSLPVCATPTLISIPSGLSRLRTQAPSTTTSSRAGPATNAGALAGGAQAAAASARCCAATAAPTCPTTARIVSAASGAPRSVPSTAAACR